MQDYNLLALQNYDMTDEEVAEEYDTFPKKLLHTPDMNLWLTWFEYLQNIEANYKGVSEGWGDEEGTVKRLQLLLAEKNEKGELKYTKEQAMKVAAKNEAEDQLINHIVNMQIIVSPRHWYDMDVSYNQYSDVVDGDPEWYLDIEKIKNASYSCFTNFPQEYSGYIQDNDGFKLSGNFTGTGKWKLDPSDQFWKTEDSINKYRKHHRYLNITSEKAFNYLIKHFGEDNLPPWAEKIKDWY